MACRPRTREVLRGQTSRPASRHESGRRKMAFTTLKIRALAPISSAGVNHRRGRESDASRRSLIIPVFNRLPPNQKLGVFP